MIYVRFLFAINVFSFFLVRIILVIMNTMHILHARIKQIYACMMLRIKLDENNMEKFYWDLFDCRSMTTHNIYTECWKHGICHVLHSIICL